MEKEESKFVLELTKQEARGLLTCILSTSASGTDLDIGETIEKKLLKFLNDTKSEKSKSCSCDGGIIVCPGCNGEQPNAACAGCHGKGIRTCGKCNGKNKNN
jgi:hypothetical protein